jgi:hypothetical protein
MSEFDVFDTPEFDTSDYEFDFTDALEDQAFTRLRDADAWSGDETEDEENIALPNSTSISL